METTPGQPLAAEPLTAEIYTLPSAPPMRASSGGVFFGPFGMRAGWSIAIWIFLYAVITVIVSIVSVGASGHGRELMAARAQARAHPGGPTPTLHLDFVPLLVIVQDGLTFLALLGVCWFFSRGERRPLASYGIGRHRLSDVLPGALWGLLMLSLVVFVLHAAHLLVFDGQNLHGTAIVFYGLKWLLAFTLVGFSEEYTFRGYVQFTLMRGVWRLSERISATSTRAVAFWIAATILSLGFACAHLGNGGENLFGLVQVFLAGIVFSYALWRTGSLWWGIGFHATWDWAQSFLFGVADSGNISIGRLFITHPQGKPILSGGADGPEGSIFASIALLVTIAIIHYTASSGPQPAIEQQPALVDAVPSPS
jgi:membrane protease YdiL (CAAX protease family)